MDTSFTPEQAAELPAPVRAAVLRLVELLEKQQEIVDAVAEGLALLNRLDDHRAAEIKNLSEAMAIVCRTLGVEPAPNDLAERIAAYTGPAPVSIHADRDEIARRQRADDDQRRADEGDEQRDYAEERANAELLHDGGEEPAGELLTSAYWSEFAKLRSEREALQSLATVARAEHLVAVPDAHGNSYVTFGDGTGAVHTAGGWVMVEEQAGA